MRLLRRSRTGEFTLTKDLASDEAIPPYAILSHTWGADDEEVTFDDLTNGAGKHKLGYKKIRFCEEQVVRDGLEYFWIDTCCINKANKAELSLAINSMFRWYRNATRCYVYLSDVSTTNPTSNMKNKLTEYMPLLFNWAKTEGIGNKDYNPFFWQSSFRKSKWFTRGWTLQELLGPVSVEFFSQEHKRLGDKSSLEQLIHEITGIPKTALQGIPLSRFSVKDRFQWIRSRQTKLEEDKAYSLLGIFDVDIPLRYGEGMASAFKRLEEEIDKLSSCIRDLHLTDPCDDKKRLEETKGGLLEDSYRWILENSDFQRWRDNEQSRLLWIKGNPGKGKTMLLCGIINELNKSMTKTGQLAYFFCQATDSRINNATAVLRGLLYLLVNQQPSLVSHIRKKYDHAGKALFEDTNAWVALSEIFTNILQDPSLNSTYLVIDALDECVADLRKLLDLIVQTSSASPRIKWIVSSRNWPDVEERLERVGDKVRLSLELNAQPVSTAVGVFIQHKVLQLVEQKKYDDITRYAVLDHLSSNAHDTFLWVALVCQNLENVPRRHVIKKLNAFPPGLDSLYDRMLQQISTLEDADLCKRILALVTIVYQPITLQELVTLVAELEDMADDAGSIREIIGLCGSFLTLREDTIYFVHQSVRDFLSTKASHEIFSSRKEEFHGVLFSRSLQAMSKTLHRDMYDLQELGYPTEQARRPDPDPIAALRYSCIYWIDHLCDWSSGSPSNSRSSLQDEGSVDVFLRTMYLYWLEALSLCQSMSKGVVSMAKLLELVQERTEASCLLELVQDAHRFIMYHKVAIESAPLQAYASALLFSPRRSLIRGLFKDEEPKWIKITPSIRDNWSPCLQTLEGHSSTVHSVAFSPDSKWLASASFDGTVKIWNPTSGACSQTLEGHSHYLHSVAFSPDSKWLASVSSDNTVKIWDLASGACSHTLEGHSSTIHSVAFSPDSKWLASASSDNTVKIWDLTSNACAHTLEGHSSTIHSVAFSPDSRWLASASSDTTVKIWDLASGACSQVLEDHSNTIHSIAFSPDSRWLASASSDNTIKIWDLTSNACSQTFEGHSHHVSSVAFSPSSKWLASASFDNTVKIWDLASGVCSHTLEGHSHYVYSVAFSPDSKWLASASSDTTVKIWKLASGACSKMFEGHSSAVLSVAFSPNSRWLASASIDNTVKIWDPASGACSQTLEGHSHFVNSATFSPDSKWLASASDDTTVKIWDLASGACSQTLEGHSHFVNSATFSPDSRWLASASSDNTVKIWDLASGACMQTLSVNKRPSRLTFDTNGSCLHTDIGSITITPSLFSSTTTTTELQTSAYQDVALSLDRIWITLKSTKLLWLPSEYRPSCSAVSGNTVSLGVGSGEIWIFQVESSIHPT